MKDAGLDISEKTLRRFKKDNGLTRKYNSKTNANGHSNFIKKEGNIIQLESPIVDIENNEKTKLINNIETLYNKYSNIKDETEAKEKYLLFTQYLQKHCTLLTNEQYNNYLKKIQEKKDYIVAMYTQDFSVFANYCTTHNVVNFS